jgi:ATP/ADP translocase
MKWNANKRNNFKIENAFMCIIILFLNFFLIFVTLLFYKTHKNMCFLNFLRGKAMAWGQYPRQGPKRFESIS